MSSHSLVEEYFGYGWPAWRVAGVGVPYLALSTILGGCCVSCEYPGVVGD